MAEASSAMSLAVNVKSLLSLTARRMVSATASGASVTLALSVPMVLRSSTS